MEIFTVFSDLFSEDTLTTCTVLSGLFFGWTIGSHYTGATLGMAYGAGVIKSPRLACLLVAAFALLGATFESGNVVNTVGTGILEKNQVTDLGAMVMMLTAALITAANTWMRWPVSTSQLACFAVVGAGMGMGAMTWGKPILKKVGKGILRLDLITGLSAKMAQSLTAHTAAMLGYPTSTNQALSGGVAGAGGARGLKTLNKKALAEIVFSWFFTLALAGIVSYALYKVLSAVLGIH